MLQFIKKIGESNIVKTIQKVFLGKEKKLKKRKAGPRKYKKYKRIKRSILAIDEEAKLQVEQIGDADILVGIPSYKNERTIGHVVRAAEYGLAKYFPKFKSVIVNSDGGSPDRTKEIVKETSIYSQLDTILIDHPVYPASQVVAAYNGIPGKGSAFKAIFEIAQALGVKACAVIDSDLRSITPEWFELLLGPIILKGYDFVSPFYQRHKYDGTITNMVVYPLTRALYGLRLRQPIGGDFGFSGELTEKYLNKKVWETDVARFGIDIWMTTVAINEGCKMCQAFLGSKIHDAKDPSKDLESMFKQVVGTVFKLMGEYEDKWKPIRSTRPTAFYGFRSETFPEELYVDLEAMIQKFKQGFQENRDFWLEFVLRENMNALEKIVALDSSHFKFPAELWVKLIYDLAIARFKRAHKEEVGTTRIVESLTSLYFGRVASFVIETKEMPTYDAENVIEAQCVEFERLKPYLIEGWKK